MGQDSHSFRRSINIKPVTGGDLSNTGDIGVDEADSNRLVFNAGSGAQRVSLQEDLDALSGTFQPLPVTDLQHDLGAALFRYNNGYIATTVTQTLTNGGNGITVPDNIVYDQDRAYVIGDTNNRAAALYSTELNAGTGLLLLRGSYGVSLQNLASDPVSGVAAGTFYYNSADNFIKYRGAAAWQTVVDLTGSQVLTNKTLTAPVIASISNGGTVTIPSGTDTLVTLTANQVLTNKTLTSPSINVINGTSNSLTLNASSTMLVNNVSILNRTIAGSGGTLQIGDSSQGVNISTSVAAGVVLDGTSSGYVELRRAGTAVAFVDAGALVMTDQSAVRFREGSGGGTNYVGIRAPATLASDYTITLPDAAPGTATALVYNGSSYVWSAAGGWTVGNSSSLAASGTISISTTVQQQAFTVQSSGGAVNLSTTPFGSSAPLSGTCIRLIGQSNTDTVTIINTDSAKGCLVNGNPTLRAGYVIEFMYISGPDRYYECYRNF